MSTAEVMGTPEYLEIMSARREELVPRCAKLFAGAGPQVLEIGSGHGHFLTAYAQAHPERSCVGIDIVGERVGRAQRKQERAGLANLHFVRADMHLFLTCVPSGTCWSEVFVLFPDPWPKSRHHKHRLMQPNTLKLLAQFVAPGGRLYFRTDFLPYFESVAGMFAASSSWAVVSEPWSFEFETVFQRRASAHHSLVAQRQT